MKDFPISSVVLLTLGMTLMVYIAYLGIFSEGSRIDFNPGVPNATNAHTK